MTIAKQAKATTFKHEGRKYITVKAVANRQEHSTTSVKLVKRAGKAHWFVATVHNVGIKGKEVTTLDRCVDFWEALELYLEGAEAIGVSFGEASQEPESITELDEVEKAMLASRLEGHANA